MADLFPEHAAYKTLLNEGWIVAKTSYRRNGVIVGDAIRDLDNLRAEIVRRVGKPNRVIVEGDSMGGLIAVQIAERLPEEIPLYDGVIAVGPALDLRDPDNASQGLTTQPQIPIVFLCNRSEFNPARAYVETKIPGPPRRAVPVLLRVNRNGHVNVNQAERLLALRTLNLWLDDGVEALPKPTAGANYVDATRIPDPLPSRVFADEDQRGFTAHVTEVSAVFGNVLLDAQPADFAAIGITHPIYFQATLRDHTFRVYFGRDFNTVKHGEWVSFLNADGFYWLARNGVSAAAASQAEVGDLVHIRRYDTAAAATEETGKE